MTVRTGIAVAVVHVAIVASLGAKLLVDRQTLPRVWVRTAPVDPDLPIRGRYVRLRVEVARGSGLIFPSTKTRTLPDGREWLEPTTPVAVTLTAEGGQLVALPVGRSDHHAEEMLRDGERVAVLHEPLAFFIPEHAGDPSIRPRGEELWAEVTLPRRGPPRPIRLGVKRDGQLTPLEVR
jgi:hypothetical protein